MAPNQNFQLPYVYQEAMSVSLLMSIMDKKIVLLAKKVVYTFSVKMQGVLCSGTCSWGWFPRLRINPTTFCTRALLCWAFPHLSWKMTVSCLKARIIETALNLQNRVRGYFCISLYCAHTGSCDLLSLSQVNIVLEHIGTLYSGGYRYAERNITIYMTKLNFIGLQHQRPYLEI